MNIKCCVEHFNRLNLHIRTPVICLARVLLSTKTDNFKNMFMHAHDIDEKGLE